MIKCYFCYFLFTIRKKTIRFELWRF